MDLQNPSYVPDGDFQYPAHNVSLQNPLPDAGLFIASLATSALPPFLGVVGIFISISIMKAIIQAFKK